MRLPAALLTVALLSAAPAAWATASPEPDPCAAVDGEVPPMCQGGVSELPFTGRDDVPALAATGTTLLLAGGAVLLAARRRRAA